MKKTPIKQLSILITPLPGKNKKEQYSMLNSSHSAGKSRHEDYISLIFLILDADMRTAFAKSRSDLASVFSNVS